MATKSNKENSDFKKYKKLFENEKNARISKQVLWENYPKLVDKDKLFYTEEDKKLIKELLYNPLPAKYRSEYWYISTGAKLECKNNPGYYQKLVNLIPNFNDHPDFPIIEVDKERAFPEIDFFQVNDNLKKLTNILKAFTIRNSPSIGYIQAFSFIAAQLLYIFKEEEDNEEKAFWCFTKIIEDYLPFNYYIEVKGILDDFDIMYSFLKEKFNGLSKSQNTYINLNAIIPGCFSSLYADRINLETLYNIWDVFFIYGDVILFKAFYFYASFFIDKNFGFSINQFPEKAKDIKQNDLLNYYLLMDKTLNDDYIKEHRSKVKKIEVEKNENIDDNDKKCDKKNPYCLYIVRNKKINLFSEYKIFKLKENTKKNEDYFSELFKNDEFVNNNSKVIKNENHGGSLDDILIERVKHVCPQENQDVKK